MSQISQTTYLEYIFKVEGESIKSKPEKIFDSKAVYLIIDKKLRLMWIWAGNHSRLFHRYMAANWAGKLKSKKKFYNFKYEIIKQGREPKDFLILIDEINNGMTNLEFPGQTREKTDNIQFSTRDYRFQNSSKISKTKRVQIRQIISEVTEIQKHMEYSIEHIKNRLDEIKKLL